MRQAYVKTAERMRGRVVVTDGLKAGDQVVTSGQLRLHNGAAVEVIPSDTVALGTSMQAPMQTPAQTVAQAPVQAD
ncbi:multidrug efflux system subunit MdtA [compost metagenome]